MKRLFSHPLTWGVVGLIVGAKMAGTVNNLPVVNKIPSR